MDEAQRIRQAYEDAICSATVTYSDHASKSITEVEVFTGNIFNRSGIQTRRQRDTSTRLKDEFNRIVKWVESLIRKYDMKTLADLPDRGEEDEEGDLPNGSNNDGDHYTLFGIESTPLELSIACLRAGAIKSGHNRYSDQRNAGNFESFKVIAAQCALRELNLAIDRLDTANGTDYLSGGYPGVRSRRPA